MKCYENMSLGENLGWCKSLRSRDGRVAWVRSDGDVATLCIDGHTYMTPEKIKSNLQLAARIVNPDYDDYEGWDDNRILHDGDYEELGCSDCPWRDECDAMDMDEDEE